MSTVTIDPAAEVGELSTRVEALQRVLKELGKTLRELGTPEQLSDTRKLKGKLERLGKLKLEAAEVESRLLSLVQRLEAWRAEQERSRPLTFGRELRQAAEEAGVAFASLAADPPTYWLEPFTLEADFSRGQARLTCSRIPLGPVPLEPAAALREHQRMLEALRTPFEAAQYLELLHRAYLRSLPAGARPGDRVELVDLLPELAMLMQPEEFRKDPTRENFRPYGRVRLAFDLARLRKSGQLTHQGGWRLTLGTATMGTTKQKDRVLFLEEGQGRGQYYLSLAFVEAR